MAIDLEKTNIQEWASYRGEAMKYKLSEKVKRFGGTALHQIVATKAFGDVKEGCLGGWIESEDNLSHEGNCWIADSAQVFGNARVIEDAVVSGNAVVSGYARITGKAKVFGSAFIMAHVVIKDNAKVFGEAKLVGKIVVSGDMEVSNSMIPVAGPWYKWHK